MSKSVVSIIMLSLTLALAGISCGLEEKSPPPPASPPIIIAFDATPAKINPGQGVNLLWNVTGADSVSIEPGVGNVTAAGTKQVGPDKDTTFILTAKNTGGTITKSVTVSVIQPPPPPPPPSKPAATRIDIVQAQQKGLIEVLYFGTYSLNNIEVRLKSNTDESLEIAIPLGLALDPLPNPGEISPGATMAVKSSTIVPLEPRQTMRPLPVPSVSINMYNNEPSAAHRLQVRTAPTPPIAIKLISAPDFASESFRIQQFAVWTVLHDPTREAFDWICDDQTGKIHNWRWTVTNPAPPYGWTGAPPSGTELQKIRVLLQKADIPTDLFRAIR